MPEVVLHQWEISPFCGKVRRILALKGVAFRTVDYNGLKAAMAARLSRAGKLPVLDWDGKRVQDSSDIARFLEERVPEPSIYPKDPLEKARAAVFEDWADESLYWYEVYFRFADEEARERAVDLLCAGRPRVERALFAKIAVRQLTKKLEAQGIARLGRDRVEEGFFAQLANLETLLEPTGWLVGSAQSIADIAVASQIDEVVRTSPLADRVLGHKRLAAWLERQRPKA